MNATLDQLLKGTSRSFYLTLRAFPGGIRPLIGLAYLLARATDTIADTEIVPIEQRLDALQKLRERILGKHRRPLDFGALAQQQGSPAERQLLEQIELALAELEKFNAADQQRIQDVLNVITSGQELDLRRFAGASAEHIIPLANAGELDDYTYRVAGCVGEFLTKIFRTHLFPAARIDDQKLLADGVRFGKGLQLVNILRDLPSDLRQGRCYVPADELVASGLSPKDLLDPANEPKFRPLYARHLAVAEGHLAAGWTYTNTLPRRCVRVRLACAWPALIGAATLTRLNTANVLNPAERIKISRSEVKKLMFKSVIFYPLPPAWRRLYPRV